MRYHYAETMLMIYYIMNIEAYIMMYELIVQLTEIHE